MPQPTNFSSPFNSFASTLRPTPQFSYPHQIIAGLGGPMLTVSLDIGGTRVIVEGKCRVTQEQHKITLLRPGYEAWRGGSLIQNALPTASPDEREFLVSGTSPTGWEQMFGDEDDHGGEDGVEKGKAG